MYRKPRTEARILLDEAWPERTKDDWTFFHLPVALVWGKAGTNGIGQNWAETFASFIIRYSIDNNWIIERKYGII
jgi:hypothetical protein